MEHYLKSLTRPKRVITRGIRLEESFLDTARRFAGDRDMILLASGGELDCARYHMLALFPWLTLTCHDGTTTLDSANGKAAFALPPLAAVKRILAALRIPPPDPQLPVCAGLFGYFAYDVKKYLEDLPDTCLDDLGLPDTYLVAPRLLLVYDRKKRRTTACMAELTSKDAEETWRRFEECLREPPPPPGGITGGSVLTSNYRQPEYTAAVQSIIDYIAAGDVYQVNLSQRFETDFSANPYDLFMALFAKNPAPFFAYINAGDHHVISTSPERFLKQQQRRIETRPIKGTRPRGETPDQDRRQQEELKNSAKDEAELSMIVDLLRNDLGKVCRGGTVAVTRHKKLEKYDNVFHQVSIVEGELREAIDAADILAATFPGGSITGCPKIRAMEIIDELEPCRRHIYTGSIGYISFHDTLDLSVAIRTATVLNRRLFYAAGGGIVYDSRPAEEFEETLAKADSLLSMFQTDPAGPEFTRLVWLNGRLRPARQATVPIDSPGFQYGAGLFETIRADNGEPHLLSRHIERFRSSWEDLFAIPAPEPDWPAIIKQVLEKNSLDLQTAAVKIMAAHGTRRQPPWDHTLAVTAGPYTHRLTALNKTGLDLMIYPQVRRIPTASHKTLNYLFYFSAGQWAKQHGGDEAVILNPDGTVSETNTANLLLIKNGKVIVPLSETVLPGVTQQAVLEVLQNKGWRIIKQKCMPEDCLAAEAVLLTNALMGAVPAATIDGRKTGSAAGIEKDVNRQLHLPG